jgi:hypoxanthine-DNA glycosylase
MTPDIETARAEAMRASGFAAIAGRDAHVLILGSLPGQRSIDAGEYYAHPRNAFWRIVEDLFDIPRALPYPERTRQLQRCGVALWDVLKSSRRRGSLDSAIETSGADVNDFAGFFDRHPRIRQVCFNGRKASELYETLVRPSLGGTAPDTVVLPSTSPAHAAMPYTEKLRRWSVLKDAATSA